MIDDEDIINITSVIFRTPDNHEEIDNHDGHDFLYDYFVNIASRTGIRQPDINLDYIDCYENVMTVFDFALPVLEDIIIWIYD